MKRPSLKPTDMDIRLRYQSWTEEKVRILSDIYQHGCQRLLEFVNGSWVCIGLVLITHSVGNALPIHPTDLHLFPALKRSIRGRYFSTNQEVKTIAKLFFHMQNMYFWRSFCNFGKTYDKYTNIIGGYVEKLSKPTSLCPSILKLNMDGNTTENITFPSIKNQ